MGSTGLAARVEAIPRSSRSVPVLDTHPSNVAARGTDAAHSKADAPSRFGDEGTLLQGVVDALDAVVLHAQQEAAEGNKRFQWTRMGRKSHKCFTRLQKTGQAWDLYCAPRNNPTAVE